MNAFIITDGHGYWVSRKRDKADRTRKLDFWSSKKRDAARIHFYEVARQIADALPMRTIAGVGGIGLSPTVTGTTSE